MALMLLTSGIGAVVTFSSQPASAAPPGFVTVPGDKVAKSDTAVNPRKGVDNSLSSSGKAGQGGPPAGVGQGGPPRFVHDKIPDHALDNVLASKYPDSTQIEFATTQNGGLSMVVTDDQNHDGREIAVPVEVFDKSLDRRPGIARGVHEDGTKWMDPISYTSEYAVFEIPKFSTNTISWSGTVHVNATPGDDGAQFTYDLESTDEVGSINLTWTGVINSEWDNETQSNVPASSTTLDDRSDFDTGSSVDNASVKGSGSGNGVVEFSGDADIDVPFRDTNNNLKYLDGDGNVVDTGQQAADIGGVGDYTGDGVPEIIYRDFSSSDLHYVNSTSSSPVEITGNTPIGISGIADWTGDGVVEVFYVQSSTNDLEYINNTGSVVDTGEGATGVGGIADYNGDGSVEVLWYDGTGNLKYLDSSGSVTDTGATVDTAIGGLGDYTGDGTVDVIYEDNGDNLKFENQTGGSYIIDSDDNTIKTTGVSGVFDWTGDGTTDVLFIDTNNNLKYINQTSQTVVDTEIDANVVGGFNGQNNADAGDLEKLHAVPNYDRPTATSDLDIAFIDSSNNLKWVDEQGNVFDTGEQANKIGGIADIDEDGDMDIMYVDTGNGINWVDKFGNVHSGTGGGVGDVGGVGDMDDDGTLEVVYEDEDSSDLWIRGPDGNPQEILAGTVTAIGGVGDIDEDGDLDVAYIDGSNNLKYVDSAGNTADTTADVSDDVGGVVDFDGDGALEILAVSAGDVYRIESGGSSTVLVSGSSSDIGGVADFDRDGDLDVAYSDGSNNLKYVDDSGNTADTGEQASTDVGFIADFDNDDEHHTTGTYTSGDNEVSGGSTGYVEIDTLSSTSIDITWEGYDGSSWTSAGTTNGITTTGNKSTTLSGDYDKYRVKIDFSETSSPRTATIGKTKVVGDGPDETVSVAGNMDPSGPSASNKAEITVTGRTDPQGDTPSNIELSTNTGESASFGSLGDGASTTKELAIHQSTDTLSFTMDEGTIDYTIRFQERTETVDPALEINGNTTSYSGTLTEGSSTTQNPSSSSVTTGTNRLNLTVGDGSLSADAPMPQVEMRYSHDAIDDQSVSYTAEEWTESYNVSKTYDSEQSAANLTISFSSGGVVSIRNIESRTNETGGWSSVSSSKYTLDGTTLTVDFGTVKKNETKEVRADGSKVQPNNAQITVLEPTTANNDLDSKIQLDTWNADSYIAVGDTRQGAQIHYITDATWSNPDEHVIIHSTGTQNLYLPNAAASEDFRVKTLGVKAVAQSGEVNLSVEDVNNDEPKFVVREGAGPDDTVEYTFVDATTDQKYNLHSITHDTTRASGTASSPLTLTDDDSKETLQFQEDTGSTTTSDGGSSSSSGGDLGADESSIGSTIAQVGDSVPHPGGAAGSSVLLILALILVAGFVYYSQTSAGQRTEGLKPSSDSSIRRIPRRIFNRVPAFGPVLSRLWNALLGALSRGFSAFMWFLGLIRNDPIGMTVTIIFIIGVFYRFGIFPAVPPEFVLVVPLVFAPLAAYLLLTEIGRFNFRVWAVVSGFAFVAMAETLQPGSIVGPLGENLGRFTGLGIIAVAILAYQVLQNRGQPDTVLNIQANEGDDTE